MTQMIGPSFLSEIEAAGLAGLPFAWAAEGVTYGDDLTPEQRAAIEAVVAAHDPDSPAPTVLQPITRRQLRLTLLAHDLLGSIEPALADLPEPERSAATIEWQDASEYRRDHALIAQIGAALALDDSVIDALWIEAMDR